jgi:hypothetical protein
MTVARRGSRRLFRATVRCRYANDRVAGRGANGSNPALDEFVCLARSLLTQARARQSAPRRSCAGLFCRAASPCSPILRIDVRVARAATSEGPAPLPPGRAVSPRALGDIGAGRSAPAPRRCSFRPGPRSAVSRSRVLRSTRNRTPPRSSIRRLLSPPSESCATLERAGFVVMKKPPVGGHSALARGR